MLFTALHIICVCLPDASFVSLKLLTKEHQVTQYAYFRKMFFFFIILYLKGLVLLEHRSGIKSTLSI